MVTSVNPVREQIRIAAGAARGYKQRDVRFSGHAIECRINAEDPKHFAPCPGRVTVWVPPSGPNVRVDSHMMFGSAVPPHYDSLIANIIVPGKERPEAIARMQRALSETLVDGLHVGQADLPTREARRLLRPGMILGVSTHDLEQARRAVADGADYVAVGSIFPTGTKAGFQLVGPELIRRLRPEVPVPLVGIGGISAVCAASDPAAAARRFLERIVLAAGRRPTRCA
jgi:hypothetical protein